MHRARQGHDYGRFSRVNAALSPLNGALFCESNPIAVKWALSQLGLVSDELRLPLTSLSSCHHPHVLRALAGILPFEARAFAHDDQLGQVA